MPVDPKLKARAEAKRAQAKYGQAKGKLDEAGEERRKSFKRAKVAGLSLAEISQAVGLHRSRVDQILNSKQAPGPGHRARTLGR